MLQSAGVPSLERRPVLWLALALCVIGSAVLAAAAPPARAAATGDVISLWTYTGNNSTVANKYIYRRVSTKPYTFQAGDYIEYDVHLRNCVDKAGGLDVSAAGISDLRYYTWQDQAGRNGVGPDLTGVACAGWYHRKLAVPSQAVGHQSTDWTLVGENDGNLAVYAADYDNIEVTNGSGTQRASIFASRGDFDWDDLKDQFRLLDQQDPVGDADGSVAVTNLSSTPTQTPTVQPTTYASDDYVVSGLNAASSPYSADGTGVADATVAIQHALDDAYSTGGGVVWLPSGKYKVTSSIHIPPHVTLRGDWRDPDTGTAGSAYGTVILASPASGGASDPGLFRIWGGAGVNGLTVFYPGQSAASPTPYPYTFELLGQTLGTDGLYSATVKRVTMLDSYYGISDGSHAVNQVHQIRTVRGTVLKRGLYFQNAEDVSRTEDVKLAPAYWAAIGSQFSPASAPSSATVAAWTRVNGTGLMIGGQEQEQFVNLSFSDYETGVDMEEGARIRSAVNFFGLTVANAHVGVVADYLDERWALNIAGSSIKANQGSNPVALRVGTHSGSGAAAASVLIKDTVLGGGATTALKVDGDNYVNCHSCTFDSWTGPYAVVADAGTVAIEDATFTPTLTTAKKGVHLNAGVTSAVLLGNHYTGAGNLYDSSTSGPVQQADSGFTFFASPATYTLHATPRPASDRLFNVTAYGAVHDGSTDDTAAIQSALNAAGVASGGKSGGTVYLPPGVYNLTGHLTVPAGTELRGSDDVMHRALMNGPATGTILLAHEGKGTGSPETATAFITLNGDGAGVRGLGVHYPDQNTNASTIATYPWTIRGNGARVYAYDTTFTNPYQAIDFATNTTNDHYVGEITGFALKTGIKVGSATHGTVEDTLFSINGWSQAHGLANTLGEFSASTNPSIWNVASAYAHANGTTIEVASGAADEHLVDNFVYGTRTGLTIEGSAVPTVINVGHDSTTYPLYVTGTGGSGTNGASVTNALSCTCGVGGSSPLTVQGTGGTLKVFNQADIGGGGPSADISGSSNVVIDGGSFPQNPFTWSGSASGAVEGVWFRNSPSQGLVNGSAAIANWWGNVGQGGFGVSLPGGAASLLAANVAR